MLESITVNDITIHSQTKESMGTEVYYARIIPPCGICYTQNLEVRYIYEDSFSALDKVTKSVQLISNKLLGEKVFLRRKDAEAVVKVAEKSGRIRKLSKEKVEDED